MNPSYQPNAKLDLSFERIVDVPRKLVWRAWTQPKHLMPWFCPLPWKTIACEIDLRLGGKFYTVMQSPEGRQLPNSGCYLEVIENERLTWSNALLPGFRPALPNATYGDEEAQFFFTATIELAAHGTGTRYTATVIHADAASGQRHAAMGYEQGWGKALEQMVSLIRTGHI